MLVSRCVPIGVLFLIAELSHSATTQRDRDLAEIGDWVQIGLPAAGYLGAWLSGDREGTRQLTKTLLSAGAAAHLVKFTAERRRPDASDQRSFPSGHTTAAFAGSEFIRQRYGNSWGIPATLAAGFVGYSRIRARKHFRDDVLAGASNGLLWNWFFTTPRDGALSVSPDLSDGAGVRVAYDPSKSGVRMNEDYQTRPRYVFSLEYGPVTQDKNLFASPPANGSIIDLATAENEFDFTSRVSFEYFSSSRHEWGLFVAPMELIEFEPSKVLPGDFDFAGKRFSPSADTNLEARYNLVELRAVYRYRLIDNARFSLRIGGGVQYLETLLDVTQFRGSPRDNDVVEFARAQLKQTKALASLRANVTLSKRWRLDAHADGYGGSDRFLSAGLLFNWRAAPEWELGIGYRYLDRSVSDARLKNELEVGDLVLSVTHGFF